MNVGADGDGCQTRSHGQPSHAAEPGRVPVCRGALRCDQKRDFVAGARGGRSVPAPHAGRPPRAPPPSHAGRIRAARSRWPPGRRSVLSSPSGGPASVGGEFRSPPQVRASCARNSPRCRRGEAGSFRAGPGVAAPSGSGRRPGVRGDTGGDVRRDAGGDGKGDTGSDTAIRGRRPFFLLSPGFSGGEWPDFLVCCPSCPWWWGMWGGWWGGGGPRNGRALRWPWERPPGPGGRLRGECRSGRRSGRQRPGAAAPSRPRLLKPPGPTDGPGWQSARAEQLCTEEPWEPIMYEVVLAARTSHSVSFFSVAAPV